MVEPTIVELIVIVFVVIVDPNRVEKVPERVEKEDTYMEDWIVSVDLISISFAVYFRPDSVETVMISADSVDSDAVDPTNVEKFRSWSVTVEPVRVDPARVVK
jgi:hypothetical protein